MAIKLKRSEHYSIQEEGLYFSTITEISTCITKKGESKVILTLQPRNIETGEQYRRIEVWLDIDGDTDSRVNSLLDSLPSKCEKNLETAIDEEVGIVININTEKRLAYINVVNFFDIDEDFANNPDDDEDDFEDSEDDFEDDDEDEEDEDEEDEEQDDGLLEEGTELKQPNHKLVSPPRRRSSSRR